MSETFAVAAHEINVVLPGSFVVLQGMSGDGLSNTIDSHPVISSDEEGEYHHVESSSIGVPDEATQNPRADEPPTSGIAAVPGFGLICPSHHTTLALNPLGVASAAALSSSSQPAPPPPQRPRAETDSPRDDSYIVVADSDDEEEDGPPHQRARRKPHRALTAIEERSIESWRVECRNREVRQRKEWRQSAAARENSDIVEEQLWWQSEGCLAIMEDVPQKVAGKVLRKVVGTLAPGYAVVGNEMICLDSVSFSTIHVRPPAHKVSGDGSPRPYSRGRKGWIQLLRLESPRAGFVVLSLDGYAFLAPGLPSLYVDPRVWLWRVTCPVGAYVREGLDLNTQHVDTIPCGSLVRVTRKTVNSMGLSRLRVECLVQDNDEVDEYGGVRSQRLVEGWCSEFLNPLSGQRGTVIQPVPFPVPALYRVRLPEGAVIRSGVELSSPQVGHATKGTVLTVVRREFSEHPMDQCIERLQLAGNGGWISVRLNRPPPADDFVVELIGIDGTFDPDAPGVFHLDAQQRVKSDQQESHIVEDDDGDDNDDDNDSKQLRHDHSGSENRTGSGGGDISSIDDEDGVAPDGSPDSSSLGSSLNAPGDTNKAGPRRTYTAPVTRREAKTDDRCLICLTEERNATIVHGETGHIACCLVCARILKARGDRCPVCRLPIDSVIQQFWA